MKTLEVAIRGSPSPHLPFPPYPRVYPATRKREKSLFNSCPERDEIIPRLSTFIWE